MITQRKKAVLALWRLYKAMSNTVDSLIINREDIPSADQWINDLESDMKVVKEWISALSKQDAGWNKEEEKKWKKK